MKEQQSDQLRDVPQKCASMSAEHRAILIEKMRKAGVSEEEIQSGWIKINLGPPE